MSFKFVPYRFQGTTDYVVRCPATLSIVDPELNAPITPSDFMSYGNCKIVHPNATHQREIRNYTDLALSKQAKTILATNNAQASRELYTEPSNLCFYALSPTATPNFVFGQFFFTIRYTFSGWRSPVASMP